MLGNMNFPLRKKLDNLTEGPWRIYLHLDCGNSSSVSTAPEFSDLGYTVRKYYTKGRFERCEGYPYLDLSRPL